MSSNTTIDFASLSANGSTPESDKKYQIKNFAYGHFLDNAQSKVSDANPILSWSHNSPQTNNQLVCSLLPKRFFE